MYTPSKEILENYAKLMVHYGLGHKNDLKGKSVWLRGGEATKPLYAAIHKEIIKSGGNVIHGYMMDDSKYNLERDFYENAQDHQIGKFEDGFYKGMINQIDHYLYILGENNPQALAGIDAAKIAKHESRLTPWMKWREDKELRGEFSWSLCLYGTEALAKEANITLEEYWEQIINACYLREDDVVNKWKDINDSVSQHTQKLNDLEILEAHITGPDIDLHIGLNPLSAWKCGGGANIPSFETWTSPDWRKTNGWIKCNNPWYAFGNKITGVYLRFEKGCVVEAKADENDVFLQKFLQIENANKIGEFSLTDAGLSNIDTFMADTLYDENRGGMFGNMHIALGTAYSSCYKGDASTLTKEDLEKIGFNQSNVHQDIVLTTDHTVTITKSLKPENINKVVKKKGRIII